MRIFYLIFICVAGSCSNGSSNKSSYTESSQERSTSIDEDGDGEEYSDGTWCAGVEYYNPNTGTRNTYSLDVEVEGGELVQINWPNGGRLDESHFFSEEITDGECSFTSDRGYEYTVSLNEKGGCGSTDAFRMRRDMEKERKAVTCPKCGEEKEEYEDVCEDCEDEGETCPKCNGYKNDWERICSECEDEIKEQERELYEEEE